MRPRRLVSLLVAGCMVVSMVPASAVTAFADAGAGTSMTEQVGSTAYQKLAKAIADAKEGDTITLSENVDVQKTLVVNKKLTLDLAGHKLYNTQNLYQDSGDWSLISVRRQGDLTITGNGVLDAKKDDCFPVDLQDETAKLTIENGEFIGNIAAIYAHTGEAVINGGEFWIQQVSNNNGYGLTLNCLDTNRRNGTAKIHVTGGTYYKFDPANNCAEGANTNFCVNGYTTKQEGDWYTVNPRTYENVDTDVKPDEKNDTTEVGKPVDIDVTVTGNKDEVYNIAKFSLNFSDPKAVETVKLKIDDEGEEQVFDLTGFASRNYQDILLSELIPEGEETGIALLSDELTTVTGRMTLILTYNTSGEHSVGVVFKDIGDAVVSSSQKEVKVDVAAKSVLKFTDCTATVDGKEIASGDEVTEGKTVTLKLAADVDQMKFGGFVLDPQQDSLKKVDDTTATFTMPDVPVTVTVQLNAEDSDGGVDALTVVAGVAVGAGTAVLAYHIGTEVYAEQVLGKGVAVPKTRADVALKAWELAGKPAVAVGEPLSEAAQAEKWAVESGLMQNDAQGNFNGQKKMNKLAALRTLDAAKKLG